MDPKYQLPDDERWMAAVRGKERPHSGWLREGLATSVAIVANHGDEIGLALPRCTAAGFGSHVVRRTLSGCRSWESWASLGDVLPILAEASPDAFLSALEGFLDEQPDQVRGLLSDGRGNVVTGECKHAGLLWALERLAWHPKHLSRACVALARLDAADPGGSWGNRPSTALCDALLWPGEPYTFAEPGACLQAVDAVVETSGRTGWLLLLAAVEPLRTRMVRNPPAYLVARPEGWHPWTVDQVQEFGSGLSKRLRLMIRAADDARIADVLAMIWSMPEDLQQEVGRWLERAQLEPAKEADDRLWSAVRRALNQLRTRTLGWVAAAGVEDRLARADAKLAPTDPWVSAAWLFGRGLPLLADGDDDWRRLQSKLDRLRIDAARRLLDATDAQALTSWSAKLEDPFAFWSAVASAATDADDRKLAEPLLALAEPDLEGPPVALHAYARRRLSDQGATWLERWLSLPFAIARPAATAALCCVLPFDDRAWARVSHLGADVERAYWRWAAGSFADDATKADREHAISQVINARRPLAALKLVSHEARPAATGPLLARLARCLLAQLDRRGASVDGHLAWEVEQLFLHLDAASDLHGDELVSLEWSYFPLLVRSKRKPQALHRLLASDPAVFAQMAHWARRGDPADAAQRARAVTAYDLLRSWRRPFPGETANGLDGNLLGGWIVEARRLCREGSIERVGDALVGELLARAPADPTDGAWPHRLVREVLCSLRSDSVDEAFVIETTNSRGMTSRGPLDGGDQERVLASRYDGWADTMRGRHHRAAVLLDRVSEHYRAHAKREDAQAELSRFE